jgi:GNAT superfamily N-acetyltransferase
MKVGIREFQDDDAPAIQVFDRDFAVVLQECRCEGWIRVAVANRAVVGYFALVAAQERAYFDEDISNWAELRELHVHPRFQRQGVGTRLVKAALDLAERQGFSRVYASAEDFNLAAQRTYLKAGFHVLNRVIRYRFVLKSSSVPSSDGLKTRGLREKRS